MPDYLESILSGQPSLLSVDEIAELLRLKPQTIYRWLNDGSLPGYKVRTSWVIPREGLRDFLSANANDAAREADKDTGGHT